MANLRKRSWAPRKVININKGLTDYRLSSHIKDSQRGNCNKCFSSGVCGTFKRNGPKRMVFPSASLLRMVENYILLLESKWRCYFFRFFECLLCLLSRKLCEFYRFSTVWKLQKNRSNVMWKSLIRRWIIIWTSFVIIGCSFFVLNLHFYTFLITLVTNPFKFVLTTERKTSNIKLHIFFILSRIKHIFCALKFEQVHNGEPVTSSFVYVLGERSFFMDLCIHNVFLSENFIFQYKRYWNLRFVR